MSPISDLMIDANEIDINKPGEVWVLRGDRFERHERPAVTYAWACMLANFVGTTIKAELTEEHPLLSGQIPGSGERIQFVAPPAVYRDTLAISIRIPSKQVFSLDSYEQAAQGMAINGGGLSVNPAVVETRDLIHEGKPLEAIKHAVLNRLNIVLSGETGSGKTGLINAMAEIIPAHERLVTIEDSDELRLSQPNVVRLFYPRSGQSKMKIGPVQLLEATLRLNPHRIIFGELRGQEVFPYIQAARSGHPGITTVHARTPIEAIENILSRSQDLTAHDMKAIDLVIQLLPTGGCPVLSDVYFPGLEVTA